MSLIKKATWLDVCPCGDHACFVLNDDAKGNEFCSKDAGRRELKRLHSEQVIDKHEFRFLSDLVNSCRLPISDISANLSATLTSEILNEHRSRQKREHSPKYVM